MVWVPMRLPVNYRVSKGVSEIQAIPFNLYLLSYAAGLIEE